MFNEAFLILNYIMWATSHQKENGVDHVVLLFSCMPISTHIIDIRSALF